jgi:hypothetical protein
MDAVASRQAADAIAKPYMAAQGVSKTLPAPDGRSVWRMVAPAEHRSGRPRCRATSIQRAMRVPTTAIRGRPRKSMTIGIEDGDSGLFVDGGAGSAFRLSLQPGRQFLVGRLLQRNTRAASRAACSRPTPCIKATAVPPAPAKSGRFQAVSAVVSGQRVAEVSQWKAGARRPIYPVCSDLHRPRRRPRAATCRR